MTTDLILNKINDGEKFTEVQTLRSENFKENLKSIEETRRRIANANINSTIKKNDEINNFFNQQF